jgi:hypothetical protein
MLNLCGMWELEHIEGKAESQYIPSPVRHQRVDSRIHCSMTCIVKLPSRLFSSLFLSSLSSLSLDS